MDVTRLHIGIWHITRSRNKIERATYESDAVLRLFCWNDATFAECHWPSIRSCTIKTKSASLILFLQACMLTNESILWFQTGMHRKNQSKHCRSQTSQNCNGKWGRAAWWPRFWKKQFFHNMLVFNSVTDIDDIDVQCLSPHLPRTCAYYTSTNWVIYISWYISRERGLS